MYKHHQLYVTTTTTPSQMHVFLHMHAQTHTQKQIYGNILLCHHKLQQIQLGKKHKKTKLTSVINFQPATNAVKAKILLFDFSLYTFIK